MLVFDGFFSPPSQILLQARNAMEAYALVQTPSNQIDRITAGCWGQAKWTKPAHEELKCNWDAALNSLQKHTGVWVVVWDGNGSVVAALARHFPCLFHPTVAESMGAWQVVELCRELGLQQVTFEGDSLIIVSALKGQDPCWSSYGQIIEDTRVKLQSFSYMGAQPVSKEANNVAHCLAKAAVSQMLDNVWTEECTPLIQDCVLVEQYD